MSYLNSTQDIQEVLPFFVVPASHKIGVRLRSQPIDGVGDVVVRGPCAKLPTDVYCLVAHDFELVLTVRLSLEQCLRELSPATSGVLCHQRKYVRVLQNVEFPIGGDK